MGYWKPTPKKWRQVGDSILLIGTTITSYAIFAENHYYALASLILTVLGKIITNFAKEDESQPS